MKSCGIVERYQLERQGCKAKVWSDIFVAADCDLSVIENVYFGFGITRIGKVRRLHNAVINNCAIGDDTYINEAGRLQGLVIGNHVTIENVGTVEVEPETTFGLGTPVSVLDETGSRPVYLFPGISAQLATLMTMRPHKAEDVFLPRLQQKWGNNPFPKHVADGATLRGCRLLRNVHVGRNVCVEGGVTLENGAIINNAATGKELARVNGDVDARNFIIEDGEVGSGALLRNVYVGQGVCIEKGFTAHDSLFFANCAMENGEACALLAGPYTVSMHKSSLLIGASTCFMNAGSATNFSNHMYKLGPVHWGVLERGVKTASGAYIMWGGRIGAFSLVMGEHKHHPDTTLFPFSYLFSDDHGHTVVAPGLMLRSCGLQRDERKWPVRDKRLKRRMPLHDNVCYDVLNPFTVQAMLRGLPLLRQLANSEPDERGMVHHQGVSLKPGAALRGYHLYSLAITRYLYEKMHEEGYANADPAKAPEDWIDLCGQIIPRSVARQALNPDEHQMPKALLDEAFKEYTATELSWARSLIEGVWADNMKTSPQAVVELESLVEEDRNSYKASLAAELAIYNTSLKNPL